MFLKFKLNSKTLKKMVLRELYVPYSQANIQMTDQEYIVLQCSERKKTILKSAWQACCLCCLLNYGSLGWKTLIAIKCQVCSMRTCQRCLLDGVLQFRATIRAIINPIVNQVTKSNSKSHSLREKLCIHITLYQCMFNINCMFNVKCTNLWGK